MKYFVEWEETHVFKYFASHVEADSPKEARAKVNSHDFDDYSRSAEFSRVKSVGRKKVQEME